ncbi:DUF2513 domain-containing protein [uncultured Anaerovibrio sp.]|uniref:DUF2513 domain-containing protein n=1 Tax=uncultured Anaerovibrio sp. TaxID=361586 RepID=UPI002622CEBA|nr:DUF2513 domain-containing protein [uncultured Anaerovibrio sp.]
MKLNLDCVRDILLCVEENTGYRKLASFVDIDQCEQTSKALGCEPPKVWPYQNKLMESYSNQELMYHFKYCADADLIETDDRIGSQQFLVGDLTPEGHEALSAFRSPKIFEKIKDIALDMGVRSLPAYCEIGSRLVNQLIDTHIIT